MTIEGTGVDLAQLDASYLASVDRVYSKQERDHFRSLTYHPLASVGVGGSSTAAAFAVELHRRLAGQPARLATTLEIASEGCLPTEAVILVSARGKNKDVLGAMQALLTTQPAEMAILLADPMSPLGKLASEAEYPLLFDIRCGIVKDGFLATNTLISTMTHLYRLYNLAIGNEESVPSALARLMGVPATTHALTTARTLAKRLSQRKHVLCLYDGWGKIPAIDLETRMHEAGLAHVQLCDIRSLAHGRHFGLYRNTPNVAILAFVSTSCEKLLNASLALLPKDVICERIRVNSAGDAIKGVVECILLADALASAQGVNLMRPGVPQWGRELYGLGPLGIAPPKRPTRKVASPSDESVLGPQLVRGIVTDLDGTLLERHERLQAPRPSIIRLFEDLLVKGAVIGIASGRGKSLFEQLDKVIPKKHRDRVMLGYYAGGIVSPMSEGPPASVQHELGPHLKSLAGRLETLNKPQWFSGLAEESRENHVALRPRHPRDQGRLLDVVRSEIAATDLPLRAALSGHTVDVTSNFRGKLAVVDAVAALANAGGDEILRIGDQGDVDGNDFELLNHPLGVSVGTCAPGPDRCLDATIHGLRGPKAVERVLSLIRADRKGRLIFHREEL